MEIYFEDSDCKPQTKRVKRRPPKANYTWTCTKCSEQFPTRQAKNEHSKTHKLKTEVPEDAYKYDHAQEVYTCTTCSAEFQEKLEVEGHVLKHHVEVFTCDVCQEKFASAYPFSAHMFTHSKDKTFSCPLCSYITKRRPSIASHIDRIHYHKFYYYCSTCGKGTNDAVVHKEHENQHLGLRPFVCVVCDKSFVFSRYLLMHQIRYHTVGIQGQIAENQCGLCMRTFAKTQSLANHMKLRHETKAPRERKHLCDMCGKGFATKEKLRAHYRTHTGVKPFACSHCGKKFVNKHCMVMHERIHTGEKPYTCEHCGKSFNQSTPLQIHIRRHTGERPYICNFCGSGYPSKGTLDAHRKTCLNSVA